MTMSKERTNPLKFHPMTYPDPQRALRLICTSRSFAVRKTLLRDKFGLFLNNPDLLGRDSYSVQANVTIDVFSDFLKPASGKRIDITEPNARSFLALCNEFGFEALRPDYVRILRRSPTSHPNPDPKPAIRPSSIPNSSTHAIVHNVGPLKQRSNSSIQRIREMLMRNIATACFRPTAMAFRRIWLKQ
jgi:hypothetical protein